MLKLMGLELEKFKIRTYILASILSCIILIVFTYFIALISSVENDPLFQNYTNILKFISLMGMIIFTVLSSIMYSRIIVEDYIGKKLVLLFSYPVSRKKILLAKIFLVELFTVIAFIVTSVICVSIFSITESIRPIVNDTLTLILFLSTIKTIFITAFTIGTLGILSMALGFIKKSIPTTIVTSFVLTSTIGNMIINYSGHKDLLFLGILILLDFWVIEFLIKKINQMDAL